MAETIEQWIRIWAAVADRLTDELRRDERGAGVIEWMAIGALSVAAIVVINAALTNLGLDIVHWARGQLGISGS
jgi:hypothetical protein